MTVPVAAILTTNLVFIGLVRGLIVALIAGAVTAGAVKALIRVRLHRPAR